MKARVFYYFVNENYFRCIAAHGRFNNRYRCLVYPYSLDSNTQQTVYSVSLTLYSFNYFRETAIHIFHLKLSQKISSQVQGNKKFSYKVLYLIKLLTTRYLLKKKKKL